jgi:hypothetical protein
MGGFFMEKFVGFCKENEDGACKPDACRTATCSIGKELRESSIFKKCKDKCRWTKEGINGINTCKDPYCSIGETIVFLRKQLNNVDKT